MPALVSDIVNAVINLLSQVPGGSTQLYATGRILQHVQDALLLEMEEMWWPDYMTFVGPISIDANGYPTAPIVGPLGTPVSEWRDIQRVFADGSNKPLRELPQSLNPALVTGGAPRFTVAASLPTPGYPFRVMPHVGPVWAWCRQRPALPLKTTDKVYIDNVLLQYDACWMYAVDDGTIPAQVNKFQVLAQNRRRMIKAGFAQHPLELDPRYADNALIDGVENSDFFQLDEDPLA